MRDYGKVHTSFWSSKTIRSLSEDGRTLAVYLITSPHSTIAGVFRLPDGYVCEDLHWSVERVAEGFAELFANGFATRCEATKWVFVHNHLKFNAPENPNQRKSAGKVVAAIPDECSWRPAFMRLCGELVGIEAQSEQAETANPLETVAEPFANQKQKQKQKQEQKQDAGGSPEAATAVSIPLAGGAERAVTQAEIDEWQKTYPAVNVLQQLTEMRAWCKANTANRKTARGVSKFIVGWLAGEQDKGARAATAAQVTVPARPGADPALAKIAADDKLAVPMPQEIRAKLASLRGVQA